jgi:AcrR family transcriptional regulator
VTPADAGGFAGSVREHDAILNAIEAGDAARAEKLVREHARFALRGVRNAIERPDRGTNAKPAAVSETRVQRPARQPTRNVGTAGPTSELLLDAAAALFCEKGFNETTTREIAARLNIHQSSLYYHVSGKEELLYRISKVSLGALERRVAAAIRDCAKGSDRLNAFIRGHLEGMFENPNRAFAFISEFRSLSRTHRQEMSVLRRNHSDLLKQEIASAVKAGILRQDISVSVLRLALLNYLNWTPRWYHVSGRLPLDDLAGIYSRMFFEGVVTQGHGRPALPQLQSQRRRRPGKAHNATLDKFVRTAAELFSKQGYASTSTRALSALIGMEKATLYYHVRSKEDLLYLIAKSSVEALQEDVQRAVEGITCPLDHLAVLMRAHCTSLLRDQTQHATVLAEVRALSPERLAEIVEMRKNYQTGLRRIIEAGQKNKSIRSDVEPRYLACILQGLLDRTVEWYRKGGSLAPAELADSLCEIFLFGAGKTAARATER